MWWWAGCAAERVDSGQTEGLYVLSGRVSDADGEPIERATLQVCAEICVVGESTAGGQYAVEGLTAGRWSVHVVAPDAAILFPIELVGSTVVDVVTAPLGPEIVLPAEATEIEVAPGLTVTLSADALPWTPHVRAGVLAGDRWPTVLDVEGTVVSGWVLTPFGVNGVVPFRVAEEGTVWSTSADGLLWERTEALATLGAVVLVR